jgi:DNA-directed RNA polymerase subunit beta'
MKENVICGHKIPAGTGQREFGKLVVGSMEAMEGIANVNRMRNPAILDEPQSVNEL